MRKLILLLLATYTIMANTLPQPITTTITTIQGNIITLATTLPEGRSGIVVHNYGNGLSAITHSVISNRDGTATLLPYRAILHPNIPTIKTEAKIDDKVILGGFYKNALVIAPDARIYQKIIRSFNKRWIHPDAYALEFMKEEHLSLSLDSLQKFARANQVGLVLIASKNRLLILDPISQKIIDTKAMNLNTERAMRPFFSRFEQMDVSLFGWSDKELKDYYIAIEELK